MKNYIPPIMVSGILTASLSWIGAEPMKHEDSMKEKMNNTYETAVFGGGCFWCSEAVYERVEGVQSVVSGYAGGHKANSTYREVTTGKTGHAEVIQIHYDPSIVSYERLLEIFFKSHNPTTKNRQGGDVGSQYRSTILYRTGEERRTAEKLMARVEASGAYPKPIVTIIQELEKFYPAENYHQDYFSKNPNAPYCVNVIQPKLEKLDY